MKLFAVFVGGNHPQANIELHDLRFVAGASIEAVVPQLRAAWWGEPASLHIDGYAELDFVDGRRIDVLAGPPRESPDLSVWFVNVGGYTPALFGEQHHYLFMTGATRAEVWARARLLSPDWTSRHKDNLATIDEVIDISGQLALTNLHIHVGPQEHTTRGPRIVSAYMPL